MKIRHGVALTSVAITVVTAVCVFFRLTGSANDLSFTLPQATFSMLPFAALIIIIAASCRNTLAALLACLGSVLISSSAVYFYFIKLDPFAVSVLPYILLTGSGLVALLVFGEIFFKWLMFPKRIHHPSRA